MLHLPDPVHPFAVHFPVAFLLLGAVVAVVSLLMPARGVLRLAFLMMVLGAAGASWAHHTGLVEARAVRYVAESVGPVVEEHRHASDRMMWAAWLAAGLAAAAWFTRLIPGFSLLTRLGLVAGSVFLLWTMQSSLHTGSQLTHRHFFGPNAPKPLPGTEEVIRLRVP